MKNIEYEYVFVVMDMVESDEVEDSDTILYETIEDNYTKLDLKQILYN